MAKPLALAGKFVKKPTVSRGSFVAGRAAPVGLAGRFEVGKPWPGARLTPGPRGAAPGLLPRWGLRGDEELLRRGLLNPTADCAQ